MRFTAFAFLATILCSAAASAADKPWPIDEVMGSATAPVTIIEYASLTCPHCAEFAIRTLPEVKKNWIDTGKAKLIFRDFPTPPADRAQAAAMVAHCSGGRYFAYLDAFYSTQESWSSAPEAIPAIKRIAKLGGMSDEQVDNCLADSQLLGQINARVQDAHDRYAIESTPSFLIDGKLTSGYKTYDDFVKLLPAGSK